MSDTKKKNSRLILILFLAVFLIGGIGVLVSASKSKHANPAYAIPTDLDIDGTVLDKARVLSQFDLTDYDGKEFSKDSLKGHWTMMFFGFTNCGYVCPTTLSALNKMYGNLKAQLPMNLLPQIVMVSVDPARDSVARMKSYVQSFNPTFVGLRGSMAQTKMLAQQMSVVFVKVQMGESGNYSVNHSAEIMLLDPNGNLRAFMSYPHKAQQMLHDYEEIIKSVNRQHG